MGRFVWLGAAIASATIAAVSSAQPAYNLVDLATLSPNGQTIPNGINDAGHITGYTVIDSTNDIHTFVYRNGQFEDLGLLGYPASTGISINNSDQLAADGIGPGSTALFYNNGQPGRIGSVDGGFTSAYSINNLGHIVGLARNGDGNAVGFSWIGGVFTDLSPLGAWRAASINDLDQIVGSSSYYWTYGGYGHSSAHAFLYSGGVFTDLGSLTGNPRTNTEAFGINRAGQIVGYSTASDNLQHAFLYSGGSMHDLGTLDGDNATAAAINDSGLVIGNLTNAYNANLGAFLVSDGAMVNFADVIVSGGTGWSGFVVTGLNNRGAIVGYGAVDGATHGFLAEPAQPTGVRTAVVDLRSAISVARPNPFHQATEITFTVSPRGAAGNTRLEIFDPEGRHVATLLDGRLAPGAHSVPWAGRTDSGAQSGTGVYFARLTAPDGSATRKLLLMR